MNRLDQLYFNWLVNGVITSKEKQQRYSNVLLKLYSTEFVSYDDFDDNLIDHCYCMREEYYNFSKTASKLVDIYGELSFEPSVLEIMVYLAQRIETTIMSNSEYGNRTELWFCLMMESLDIKRYDNSRYNESEVEKKLENFIERRYEKNGFGGLFTVDNRTTDARKCNIWSQCMDFLTDFAKNNGELI